MNKPLPRRWDWISAGLLFLLFQVVAARLVTTDWAPFLYFTETLAAFGFILGLALGLSRFRRSGLVALVVAYTCVLLPWQLSGAVTDDFLWDRLKHVAGILWVSVSEFAQRQPVRDSLFFVGLVGLLFWFMALAAGYRLTRFGSILASLIMGGAGIITIQAYANYQPRGSWWLAVFLLLALLLVGRHHFVRSEGDWSLRRVFINDESWSDILGSLLTTAALVILLAWLIPTSRASLQQATDAWNTFSQPIRERLSNAVTSLNGPYGKPGTNFYGATLPLGDQAAQGDSPVFTVKILQEPDAVNRYYWRGRAYDEYGLTGWSASPAPNLSYVPAQGDLGIPDGTGRSGVSLELTSQFTSQTLLYGPSVIVGVDRAAHVSAVAAGEFHDVLSWQATTFLASGDVYKVRAEIANPTVEQLRAAGTDYPNWITAHDLDVPPALLSRFQSQAAQVAEGANNPYDRAVAITNYLRSTIQYSTSVPATPNGEDPVAWVLFDYKKGFCNYYASAEVLLLRSIGIPARLAVGFARGELTGDVYTVRRRDAHAWPEVYFPGVGWVEFEPTASQDPLLRPTAAVSTAGAVPGSRPLARRAEGEEGAGAIDSGTPSPAPRLPFARTAAGRILTVSGPLVALALALYAAFRFRLFGRVPAYVSRALERAGVPTPSWIRYWDRWNHLEPVERAFASVNWSLRWLRAPQPVDATPGARAAALANLLPSAAGHVETLRNELETGIFAEQPADVRRARHAGLLVLIHALRARLEGRVNRPDAHDVYWRKQR